MTDIRHERRLRRHQESPDVSLPTPSGEAPSPTPPTSSGEGAISWKPIDAAAKSGAEVFLKFEGGKVEEAAWRETRGYNSASGKWEPRGFWRALNNPARIIYETPVAYAPHDY